VSKEQNGKSKERRAESNEQSARRPHSLRPLLLPLGPLRLALRPWRFALGPFLLTLPFALCILGAYVWFNTDIARPSPSALSSSPRLWLSARTNIPGYTFVPDPVSESVMKTLGTTNILSGTFYRTEVRNQKSAVSDQKSTLTSDFRSPTSGLDQLPSPNSRLLKCDFRIFELPKSANREAAAWCALAGGQPLIGTTEWGRDSISRDSAAYYFWNRAVQLKQILHTAQNRLPVREEKQFVRYSVPLESDWHSGIQAMNTFGPGWMSAYRL